MNLPSTNRSTALDRLLALNRFLPRKSKKLRILAKNLINYE